MERHAERQRLGLEAVPDEDGGGTVAALMTWWLETYSVRSASHERNQFSVRKHFLSAPLGAMRLVEVTAPIIEQFLQAKSELAPGSINHL